MATWLTKITGDTILPSHINDLQTGKVDVDAAAWLLLIDQDQAVKTTSGPVFTTVEVTNYLQLPGTYYVRINGNQNFAILSGPPAAGFTGDHNISIGSHNGFLSLTSGQYNVGISNDALANCTTGSNNIGIGLNSLVGLTTGRGNVALGNLAMLSGGAIPFDYNTAIGFCCMQDITTGYANTAIGYMAAHTITIGDRNVALGAEALYSILTGSNNVAVGFCAGKGATGNRNVFLGSVAGEFETGNDKLIIDSNSRLNEADQRIKALLYGIFDAASANQRLRINGRLGVTHLPNYANNAAAVAGGLVSGELYTVTASDPLQVAAVV